jgi:hypothetical protein
MVRTRSARSVRREWIEEGAEVDRYHTLFHHLQAAALSFDESAALMASALKEM